jgi:hypothetical protein
MTLALPPNALERGAALCAAPLTYARTMRAVLDILAEGNMQEPPL